MGEAKLTSELPEAHQRFLAKYLEATRRAGVFTNEQLFERFTHERLFAGYKDEPQSRAKLLCENSKMPFEIAVELEVNECIQIFGIALKKLKEATPDKVFAVVTADELVRVMDATELYAFLDGTQWDGSDTPVHRALAADLLREFKTEDLGGSKAGTLHAIEEAIGIDLYVEHLPKPVLAAIIRTARDLADKEPGNIAFTVDAMAGVGTTDLLAQHLPIPVLMRPIRAAAEKFGFVKKPEPLVVPPPPKDASMADADDVETTPTIPPVAKGSDADSSDPEVSFVAAASSAPDDDEAALEEEALAGGDDIAKSKSEAVVRRPDEPPPLPLSPLRPVTTVRRRG